MKSLAFVRGKGRIYVEGIEAQVFAEIAKRSLGLEIKCRDFFHYQMCSGFGGPTYCGRCGKTWRHR